MALYQSDHPEIPGMKGLHLYHFVISNCSQRVRIALEEKGLEWTSHHVNIPANEHVTSDYTRINPNNVVPTLVHDGQVMLESNDIIAHLDRAFPEPPLRPNDPAARARMEALIALASDFQSVIKVLSHELVFRAFRKVGAEEIELYEKYEADPVLIAFLRDYADDADAWKSRVTVAEEKLGTVMAELEAALENAPWLSGAAYGLADISWVVNFNRLQQAKVDLSAWPALLAWGERAMARPAFDRAVTSYQP